MVVLAALWASAGPLDGLEPLPACGIDTGAQVVFPTLVFDLAFDAEGRLWVADWSGLSVHGPDLGVLERPAPGAHGWVRLAPDGEGGFVGDNAFALSAPAVHLKHDKQILWTGLSDLFIDPEQVMKPPPIPGFDLGVLKPTEYKPHFTLEEAGYALSKQGITYRGEPWAEPDLGNSPSVVTGPASAAVLDLISGGNSPDWSRARAIAVAVDGRVASATRRGISLRDADGRLLAELPLIQHTDAVGVVRGHPFTVTRGRLQVWSADLSRHWEAPGAWTSAIEHEGGLLAADPVGRLWHLDLESGEQTPRACLAEDCRAKPPPVPAPPQARDVQTLGPQVLAWREALDAWLVRQRPHPVELHRVHGRLVVADLEPEAWAGGVHAVVGLTVLVGGGTERLAHKGLEAPVIADVFPGSEQTVVLRRGPGMEQAYSLPDLAPRDGGAQGPGFEVLRLSEFSRVSMGAYADGSFRPATGLPPRHGYQYRLDAWGTFDDERVAISSRASTGGLRRGLPWGSTEVWCRPSQDGSPRTVRSGLLGIQHPSGKTSTRPPPSEQKQLDRMLVRSRSWAGRRSLDVRPWWAPFSKKLTWVWVEQAPTLDPAVAALSLKKLRVLSEHPAPASLPKGVTWLPAEQPLPPRLMLVQHGVVVWSGSPKTFHPVLRKPSRKRRETTEAHEEAWAAIVERAPSAPPPLQNQDHFRRILAAGDLDAARALFDAHRGADVPRTERVFANPEQLTQLLAGTPVPEASWDVAPSSESYLLGVGVSGDRVWKAADAAGLPGAVLNARGAAVPGLAHGTSDAASALLGRRLVWVREGVVDTVWKESTPPETIRAEILGPGVPR